MPGPSFIIIGAMKSATSTLHAQLAAQPGIFMTEPKEPNFFSDDAIYARGLEWYESLFAPTEQASVRGEASTHYTKLPTYPHTVQRLADSYPHVKLIYVLRHPVERLISHYVHDWSEARYDVDLSMAIDRYPELIDYGRYAYQIAPYVAAFSPAAILPVFTKALAHRPHHELARIGRFLGTPQPLVWQAGQGARNVSGQRLRLNDRPVLKAAVNNPLLGVLRRRFVPKAWRQRIKDRLRRTERPALTDANQAKLVPLFDADLERLGQMLGLDQPLSCDTFDAVALEVEDPRFV